MEHRRTASPETAVQLANLEVVLSVAQIVPFTEAEGPGVRFALWFQGCPLRCPGCCNPEMLPFEGGTFGFLLKPDGFNSWALDSISAASFSDPAVPEPSTWAMMLMGLMGLGFVGWRTSASKHPSSVQFTCR